MKLATIKNGSRDGRLAVVSSDLTHAAYSDKIALTLLDALERWSLVESALRDLSERIERGQVPDAFPFVTANAMAPLPRCYQWLDGSAFANHGALMEKAFDTGIKNEYEKIPLMYQGASDDFRGPQDDIELPSESDDMDFEGEIAVVVDEIAMGSLLHEMSTHVKLLMLVNDVSLRRLAVREMKTGFGWIHGKPSTSFSPVAVTPDELGKSWRSGRVELPLHVTRDGEVFGTPNAKEMTFDFFRLLEHAAYSRRLHAGTIVGSGTVSNAARSAGSSCISERRAIEAIDNGQPSTPFMRFGERIRIEVKDEAGKSIFGAIDQRYTQAR